jgi:hypothetical protein
VWVENLQPDINWAWVNIMDPRDVGRFYSWKSNIICFNSILTILNQHVVINIHMF